MLFMWCLLIAVNGYFAYANRKNWFAIVSIACCVWSIFQAVQCLKN